VARRPSFIVPRVRSAPRVEPGLDAGLGALIAATATPRALDVGARHVDLVLICRLLGRVGGS
jgi:hypothetical protein